MDDSRNQLLWKKAAEVLDGKPVGVTIEEAEALGMKPFVEDRGWGVSAEDIFALDTEVHTTAEVFAEQLREVVKPELRGPSGHGLARKPKPYGQVTTDEPAYNLGPRARR